MRSWGQWVAIGVSIALSSAVYSMMVYAMAGIEVPTKNFLNVTVQEDFTIDMLSRITLEEAQDPKLLPYVLNNLVTLEEIKRSDPALFYQLIEDRKKAFIDSYGMTTIELREVKLIYYDFKGAQHKALLIKQNHEINLTYLEAGELPTRFDQIAINREYAKKNGIKIGDTLILNNQSFTITGFVLFPDYTFPMFDETFNVNIALQTYVLTTDAQYEALIGKETYRFSGLFGQDQDDALFKSEVLDTFRSHSDLNYITKITTTALSLRSGAIYDELVQGRVMSIGFGVFISMVSVLIVGIIIFNMLHQQRSQIGVLKALGYKRTRIALPYVMAVLVIALVMLLIGYYAGVVLSFPMKQLYLDFYLLPYEAIHQQWEVFVTSIFVPLSVFALFTFLIIRRMLKTPVLDLLHPQENQSINGISRFVSKLMTKASAKTKFTWLYALHNARSFFIFFLGILFTTLLINFSFAMDGMVKELTLANLDKMPYQYEAYVDFTKGIPTITDDQEKFLVYPYGRYEELNLIVIGLEPDSQYYPLIDPHGKIITSELTQGAIISEKLSLRKNLKIHDTVSVEIGSQIHILTIIGISQEYIDDKVYVERRLLSAWISASNQETLFTGIYSLDKPDPEAYSLILAKEDVIKQTEAMSGFIDLVSMMMIGGSALIAFCILYVLTSQTVLQNTYAISLLKVLGYRKKEVNAMILNGYLIYALLSYSISLPLSILALKGLLSIFVVQYGILLPLDFGFDQALKGFVFVLGLFYLGSLHSRMKIQKISLQEAMKVYRE